MRALRFSRRCGARTPAGGCSRSSGTGDLRHAHGHFRSRRGCGAAILAGVLRAAGSFVSGGAKSNASRPTSSSIYSFSLACSPHTPRITRLWVASGVIFGAAMVGVGRQRLLAATAAPRNEGGRVDQKSAS